MSTYTIHRSGDHAMTLSLGELTMTNNQKVLALGRWFSNNPFEGLLDVVIAYSSITLVYDVYRVRKSASQVCYTYVESILQTAMAEIATEKIRSAVEKIIPVCYEDEFSPDIEWVCTSKNITRDELISLHTSRVYRVYAVGFLPGFPYMAEVHKRLEVPRRDKPRSRVPAGSVALAGMQTGIYPVDSPGGWRVIGRTPLTLFDPERNPPVLLEAGNDVRFESISSEHFRDIERH